MIKLSLGENNDLKKPVDNRLTSGIIKIITTDWDWRPQYYLLGRETDIFNHLFTTAIGVLGRLRKFI